MIFGIDSQTGFQGHHIFPKKVKLKWKWIEIKIKFSNEGWIKDLRESYPKKVTKKVYFEVNIL
jgi:hypothetical protein